MLYSIGKDTSVMLHLALKAFYPAQAAVSAAARRYDLEVPRDDRVPRPGARTSSGLRADRPHQPGRPARAGINPFDHGSAVHTDVMKTEALKQALDRHGFDAAFGGARRDEEKSRAKERIFSLPHAPAIAGTRSNQRPELWDLYNTRIRPGESMRVFPLSNWTELDIWAIHLRARASRSCRSISPRSGRWCERDGTLIMVDDERLPLAPGETAGDALGALPHARLLSADRRGRDRAPTPRRDRRRDARGAHRPSARAG